MDPYKILNVPKGSSVEVVKKAYRQLALIHHPDKGGNSETFLKIKTAYEYIISGKVNNDTQHQKTTSYRYEIPSGKVIRVTHNKYTYDLYLELVNIRKVIVLDNTYTISKRYSTGYITLDYDQVLKHCAKNGEIIINVYYEDEYGSIADFSIVTLKDPRSRFQRFKDSIKNIF